MTPHERAARAFDAANPSTDWSRSGLVVIGPRETARRRYDRAEDDADAVLFGMLVRVGDLERQAGSLLPYTSSGRAPTTVQRQTAEALTRAMGQMLMAVTRGDRSTVFVLGYADDTSPPTVLRIPAIRR